MWGFALVVAILTFVVFLPALQNEFVVWDDDRNFLDNPYYRGLERAQLHWMWTTFHMGHYMPLSWMTLGLDYTLWGMDPAGYHLSNLLLHTANAVVLYFVARQILRLANAPQPGFHRFGAAVAAACAALLFAIHPLRVESVAWITERRDVLSGLFMSLTVLFYLRSSEGRDRWMRWYWLSLAVFVCALLSKAIAMTVPAVLLILNVYPLRRLGPHTGWWNAAARRVYLEILPFAVLGAAMAVVSMVALTRPEQLSGAGKAAVSAYSLALYVWKTIVPTNLSPLYEMPPRIDPLAPAFVVSYVAVIVLTAAAFALRRRWPALTTAWIAFGVVVLPVLGLVQNGPQIAADRYTYHAAPALAMLAVGGLSLLEQRWRSAVLAGTCGLLIALGALTWRQTKVWRDTESLWTHVVRLDSTSSVAHIALGSLRFKQDRLEEAIHHYTRGLALDPDYAEGYNNLGVALAKQRRFDEAIQQYQRALTLKPAYAEPHNNWGVTLTQRGDLAAAIEHYRQAVAIDNNHADAHTNWGNALVRLGKADEAVAHYAQAILIRPDNADAQLNWGVALAQQGKLAEAIEHFRYALAIKPDLREAREYLQRASELQRAGSPQTR